MDNCEQATLEKMVEKMEITIIGVIVAVTALIAYLVDRYDLHK